MRRKDLGVILMAAGFACLVVYVLTALTGSARIYARLGNGLLFVGLVVLVVGLVRYGTSKV